MKKYIQYQEGNGIIYMLEINSNTPKIPPKSGYEWMQGKIGWYQVKINTTKKSETPKTLGNFNTDKIDNPATNLLHPQNLTEEQIARFGDCHKMAAKKVIGEGGDIYASGNDHSIAVKNGKVYDYVLGIDGMPFEEYKAKVPYQFVKRDINEFKKFLGGN